MTNVFSCLNLMFAFAIGFVLVGWGKTNGLKPCLFCVLIPFQYFPMIKILSRECCI